MENPPRKWDQFTLILIDLQHDFWPDEFKHSFPHFPANITRLLHFSRQEGLEVIHLRAIFQPDMSDWMVGYKLRKHIPCIQGTPGVETLPFAMELPGEKVIVKQTFDGFHNSELLRYLQQTGKRFLLTAGLVTSTCVLFTTVSASQKGFLTAMVEDCCADNPFLHEQTINTYQFIFDRTKAVLLPAHYPKWMASLSALTALQEKEVVTKVEKR